MIPLLIIPWPIQDFGFRVCVALSRSYLALMHHESSMKEGSIKSFYEKFPLEISNRSFHILHQICLKFYFPFQ